MTTYGSLETGLASSPTDSDPLLLVKGSTGGGGGSTSKKWKQKKITNQSFACGTASCRRLVQQDGGVDGLGRSQHRSVLKTIITPSRRRMFDNNHSNDGKTSARTTWIGPKKKRHSFFYTMLNPRSDSWQATAFKWCISIVIILDLIAFIVSTEPNLTQEQQNFFSLWEAVDSWMFLTEYLLRLITVTESNKYGEMGTVWGRLSWMMTTPALIDLLSTLPYFVEKFTSVNLPTLTYLRSARLLRLNKTARFSEAIQSVCRVFYYNKEILSVSAMIGVGLVLFTAVLMYYLRPRDGEHPEFKSIPRTLYLSTLMLTGQGGPDGPDLPWYTSAVVLLTGVFSIGMFAIPASMLTWGFEAEAQRYAILARKREEKNVQYASAAAGDEAAQAMINQENADEIEHDNWSYSSNDYSTDEEYQKIIAGEYGEEDADEDERIKRQFELADVDGSGHISLTEFLKMSRDLQQQREGEGGSLIAPTFASRIEELERRQQEQGLKIDRILKLLESKYMP